MFKIKVKYPASLEALHRLEPTINEHAVVLCIKLGTLSYEWELDGSVDCGPYPDRAYARLVAKQDRREITSKPITFLRSCTLDEFNDILVKRSFELPREQH
jgi:hypothetical protein